MQNSAVLKLTRLFTHLEGAYAPNTLRAYNADMCEFIAYCTPGELAALPASPQTVAEFLLQCATTGVKSSTIRRKLASISAVHRLSGHTDPTKHPEVHIAMRKVHRQLGARFEQAYPITRTILDRMLCVCGDDLIGCRDRALLLVAYDSMRRRQELVSFRVEDIKWNGAGEASILLRRSKTDQVGRGSWCHLGGQASEALGMWLTRAKVSSDFVFRGIRLGGALTHSLGAGTVGRIYKKLASRAKLDPQAVTRISGHSIRVGAAQDLLVKGASLPQIMVRGGWAKTDTVIRYVERVRPWEASGGNQLAV